MRDDFDEKTKEILARRVGYRCSNPNCRKLTSGPRTESTKAVNIGVAAHITAASPSGPRYDKLMSSKERKSIDNGIWLCQNCAKLVDNDKQRYTVDLLIEWKKSSEQAALLEVESLSDAKASSNVLTAPRPDVRVLVNNCFPESPIGLDKRQMLCIMVENHSPVVVYIQSLWLERKDKQRLLIDRDADWIELRRRKLDPGESFLVPINPYEFRSASLEDLAGAMVVDDIGRLYRTAEDNFSSALERFFKNEADLGRSVR